MFRPVRSALGSACMLLCVCMLSTLALTSCSREASVLGTTPLHWIAIDTEAEGVGVLEHAAIMVEVQIGGKAVWLQLDTGADRIILSPSVLDALGIAYERGGPVNMDSFPGGISGKIPGISLAGVTWKGAGVVLWEEPEPTPVPKLAREIEDPKPFAGTLGANFFKGKVLALDFRDDLLTIFDQIPREARSASTRFKLGGNRPTMKINLGGQPRLAMYDSGSSSFEVFLRPSAFLELADLASLDDAPLKATGNSWGNQVTVYGCPYDATIEVGGLQLRSSRIWAAGLMDGLYKDTGCDVILGNELFIGRTLYLDFDGRRMAIVGEG